MLVDGAASIVWRDLIGGKPHWQPSGSKRHTDNMANSDLDRFINLLSLWLETEMYIVVFGAVRLDMQKKTDHHTTIAESGGRLAAGAVVDVPHGAELCQDDCKVGRLLLAVILAVQLVGVAAGMARFVGFLRRPLGVCPQFGKLRITRTVTGAVRAPPLMFVMKGLVHCFAVWR